MRLPLLPFASSHPRRFFACLVIFYAAKTNSRLFARTCFRKLPQGSKGKRIIVAIYGKITRHLLRAKTIFGLSILFFCYTVWVL